MKRLLRGDLDTIVLKAIKKDPDERYGTVNALAEDIERYLTGRTVLARPDLLGYRIRKFIGRNRLTVSAAAALLCMLAAFGVTTAIQAVRVSAERDRARSEQAKAEQVVRLLVDLFQTGNPEVVPGGDRQPIGEFLSLAESRVLRQVEGQPELEATMRHVLGEMHYARGGKARARELLESALAARRRISGVDAIETLTVQADLGQLLMWIDERARATTLLQDALTRIERALDAQHPLAARVHHLLGELVPTTLDAAQEHLERAVAISRARLSASDPDRIRAVADLGALHVIRSHQKEARLLLDEALKSAETLHGGRSATLIEVLGDSARFDTRIADFAGAEGKYRRALPLAEDLFGANSVRVANVRSDLAEALCNQGRLAESLQLRREAYGAFVAIFGESHKLTINATRQVGLALLLLGRLDEGRPWMRRALRAQVAIAGENDPWTALMRAQLARFSMARGRHDEAVAILKPAIERLQAVDGHGGLLFANVRLWLGRALLETGRAEQALPYVTTAVKYLSRTRVEGHPMRAEADCELAHVMAARGRPDEALALATSCVPRIATYGQVEPWRVTSARRLLARLTAARAGRH